MKLRSVVPVVAAGLALWSCAPADAPEGDDVSSAGSGATNAADAGRTGSAVADPTGESACAAAQHGSLVGRSIDEIDTAGLPEPLRVYVIGSLITMDHWPERMNIVVGADGRVVAVKCG